MDLHIVYTPRTYAVTAQFYWKKEGWKWKVIGIKIWYYIALQCAKMLWPWPWRKPCASVNRMWMSQPKDWNGNLFWKCRRTDYSGNLQITDDWCNMDMASYGNWEQAELLTTSDYTCFINCIESAILWVPFNRIQNAVKEVSLLTLIFSWRKEIWMLINGYHNLISYIQ